MPGYRLSAGHWGKVGNGPQFEVRMEEGQMVHMHLPRPPASAWGRAPCGFFWTLTLVAIAVALATYPIIRTLTRRCWLHRDRCWPMLRTNCARR